MLGGQHLERWGRRHPAVLVAGSVWQVVPVALGQHLSMVAGWLLLLADTAE